MEAGYSAFKDNLVKVNDLNAIEGSEVYGITKFSDMSAEGKTTHVFIFFYLILTTHQRFSNK